MYDFHKDKKRYFEIQGEVTKSYIIPFLQSCINLSTQKSILEIGCGEAGVLKTFLDQGHQCTGIELLTGRVRLARQFLEKEIEAGKAEIINKNIYDVEAGDKLKNSFDLIILKDVIEHIPEQEKLIPVLRTFLKPEGSIFFGFPPWYMPFGGHQQIAKSKWLSKLPWIHLLPLSLYKAMLRLFGEQEKTIRALLEIRATGISIERLKRILKNEKYEVVKEKYWLFNPIYKYKFSLRPTALPHFLTKIPFLRNFYTSALYILFR